jgi:hypothetical protein
MMKLRYLYYKEIFKINLLISICIGVVFLAFGYYGFPISFMTAGYFLSILYFETSKHDQYYFYYNKGLSRLDLYLSGLLINSLMGIVFFVIIKLWIFLR